MVETEDRLLIDCLVWVRREIEGERVNDGV